MTFDYMSFFADPAVVLGSPAPAETKSAPSESPAITPESAPTTEVRREPGVVTMGFFKRLEAAIASMWHKLPAIEVALASAVNNIVPTVEQLDTIILGPEAAVLNPILDKVKVGLSALKDTIQSSQSSGNSANLTSIVGAVQSHLVELVSAAEIKNPELAAKIKEVTDIIAADVAGIHAGATA